MSSVVAWVALAAWLAIAALGCAPNRAASTEHPSAAASASAQQPARAMYLAPNDPSYDLVTPDGIHVKTNGQYKTEATRKAAAAAIDRYWHAVRNCALEIIPQSDSQLRDRLVPEFPGHLSIEIADDWQVIEGPVSHRRQQAFPSLIRPGAWSTAHREEDALYIKVVPELNGLGRQMAGELNLWLGGNTNTLPTELSNVCATIPCYRFAYDNSPSKAWDECTE